MTKTSFAIKWQPPENDGGTPITEYIVEMKEESKKAWQKVNTDVLEPFAYYQKIVGRRVEWRYSWFVRCLQIGSTKHEVTNFSVSNLKTDVPYNFRITAKNSVGAGPPYVAEEPIAAGKRISKPIKIFPLQIIILTA